MILIGMEGKFMVWVNPRTFAYRFTGGSFGAHEIYCARPMHDDKGLFGRAAVHWDGYKAAVA